jgi:hypothetical protein
MLAAKALKSDGVDFAKAASAAPKVGCRSAGRSRARNRTFVVNEMRRPRRKSRLRHPIA